MSRIQIKKFLWDHFVSFSQENSMEQFHKQSTITRLLKKDPNSLTSTIFKDDVELFEDLVDYGFDVNQPDDKGWTPLMAAINRGNCEIVNILSTTKANLNLIDNIGWIPLFYAIELERVELISELMSIKKIR